jgi:transposase
MLLADRGYDANWIRSLPDSKGLGRTFRRNESGKAQSALVPICIAPGNLIERFFNKIKQCRRVATRYDKLAANYLAFVKLASIRIWLRAGGPRPRQPNDRIGMFLGPGGKGAVEAAPGPRRARGRYEWKLQP